MSEPTSKFNDLSSETVTKLVSIIVAIVVFAVVLVPIVNGLADGNGDGGDGGSGGEGERIILNTFEDVYGVDISPYKSYQVYVLSDTPTIPNGISYTLEDLTNLKNHFSSLSQDANDIEILSAMDENKSGVTISYNPYRQELYTSIFENNNGHQIPLTEITSYTLTITSNYQLNCSYSSTHETDTIQYSVSDVMELSTSEYGWVGKDWETYNNRFTVGSGLQIWWYTTSPQESGFKNIVITQDMIDDGYLRISTDFAGGYSTEVSFEIEPTDIEGVWKFTESAYNSEGVLIQNGVAVEGGTYFQNITTYGYTQSESGSGSSTDSGGISGTAGTILKIIPVLVGVGVILAIVALFYDPRNLIKKD